jgi:hypothetical protein
MVGLTLAGVAHHPSRPFDSPRGPTSLPNGHFISLQLAVFLGEPCKFRMHRRAHLVARQCFLLNECVGDALNFPPLLPDQSFRTRLQVLQVGSVRISDLVVVVQNKMRVLIR